jgi:hypothetical protein
MGVTSTLGFKFKLVADGVILDLFKDEEIKLSNNATGLFDLGLLPADFTRQLSLPGSKKNNHFFEFVYDISVEDPYTFATNQLVPCYLDFNGIYLADGYLQLNKVNVYQNKFVDSYEVTIYGGLASFGRQLKRYFLTDLTGSLSYLNHTSSYENITASWEGNLFSGSIVYPMAEYGQQIQYRNGNSQFGIQSPSGAMCIQDFKPAVRVKDIWDACFQQFGFTYTSAFFNESWWSNVYMIANNQLRYPVYPSSSYGLTNFSLETYGQFKIGAVSGSGQTNLTMSVYPSQYQLPWYYIQSNPGGQLDTGLNYNLNMDTALRGDINLSFNYTPISGVPQFTLEFVNTGSSVSYLTPLTNINDYLQQVYRSETSRGGNPLFNTFELLTQFNTQLVPKGTYQFKLYYTTFPSGSTVTNVVIDPGDNPKSYLDITKVNQAGDGLVVNVAKNLPFGTAGIKLIDFFSSIQKKFNLVIYPNKNKLNDFIVEPFTNWYKTGQIKDFNRYINLNQPIAATPSNNLAVQNLNFGDTLDQDYVSQQFNRGANREFGKSYYVDTTNFYSQGDYTVKTGFASSPLIYLDGTGVSGSSFINPVATSVGYCRLSRKRDGVEICTATYMPEIFSSTGVLEESAVLYYDAYGNNLVTGYYGIVNPDTCDIWEINTITGIIVASLGNCSEFGGCL